MHKHLVLLLGGLILLVAGVYYFFHELFFVWVSVISLFIRRLTLKELTAFAVLVLRRIFIVELPKKGAIIFVWMLLTPRMRGRLREGARLLRVRIKLLIKATLVYYEWLLGRHAGIFVAAMLALLVFVLGVMYLGSYVFVWVGREQLLFLLSLLERYVLPWVRNRVIRIIAFLQLDRLWRWAYAKVPEQERRRLRRFAVSSAGSVVAGKYAVWHTVREFAPVRLYTRYRGRRQKASLSPKEQ